MTTSPHVLSSDRRARLTVEAVDAAELYATGTSAADLIELASSPADLVEGLVLYVQLLQAWYHIVTRAPLQGMPDAARASARNGSRPPMDPSA